MASSKYCSRRKHIRCGRSASVEQDDVVSKGSWAPRHCSICGPASSKFGEGHLQKPKTMSSHNVQHNDRTCDSFERRRHGIASGGARVRVAMEEQRAKKTWHSNVKSAPECVHLCALLRTTSIAVSKIAHLSLKCTSACRPLNQ